ncbi:MAG: membrane protein insertase YidC [Acidobacteria bacterium]|nr:membrane protein insertase YidC [Acidobacteriota bacterium]MBV9475832.1 membrane protein insertase YidC [Acidobacteriota bacterium]
MEKRIFLAIGISIALLWIWAALAPKLFPELAKKPLPPKPAVTSTTASSTTSTAPATSSSAPTAVATPTIAPAPAMTQVVSATRVQPSVFRNDGEYVATFSNRGAQLVSFKLLRYKQKHSRDVVELVKARAATRTDFPFSIEAQDAAFARRVNSALYAVSEREERGRHVIEYRYSDGAVSVTKTFRLDMLQPYLFDFAISINPPVPYRVVIGPGLRTLSADEHDSRVVMTGNGVIERESKFRVINREKAPLFQSYDGLQYIGVEDNYFLSVLRPTHGGAGVLRRIDIYSGPKEKRAELYAGVNASTDGAVAGQAFFGPKETQLLDRYDLAGALQFGFFGAIGRFFLRALVWINTATKNYGFAIIVLTILIKIVLYPLQHKSILSMKKMQRVNPKVEAIKARYKKAKSDAEQRQKMNMEVMALYQKEGINPMAGCLPLVLQLPILWGFYGLLSRAIELRGAPFILWIHDLSDKDPTFVLPILMTATMFIQTYITPSTGDPSQRRMFLVMPLFFGFLFKDFPSGLVLYWLVQNILTIVQQSIMNKWWKEHPAELQNA